MALNLFAAFLSLLCLICTANALAVAPRDGVSPPIILPNFNTIWTVGQKEVVTWYAISVFYSGCQLTDDNVVSAIGIPRSCLPLRI